MIHCKMTLTMLIVGAAAHFLSCAPTIHLVDRQTVMEMESSGEWPELDVDLFQSLSKPGQTFYKEDLETERHKETNNLLLGNLISKEALTAHSEGPEAKASKKAK